MNLMMIVRVKLARKGDDSGVFPNGFGSLKKIEQSIRKRVKRIMVTPEIPVLTMEMAELGEHSSFK